MNGFEQISKIGEGAYSTVLKVRRLIDNNIYALKKVKLLKLSEKEKSNALNEVRILASVKSNFVISYKEAFFEEKESCLGIVMEFADKGDLYQRINEYKKRRIYFEESEIWRIFIQLVKGLKALHELKILHRDLKSANVFLFNDGSAKLGDLNVSKVAKKGLGYTQTGTPYYASPEVWNDKPYNYKSDIWSLGCVLYEMVMLKPPFRAENMDGLYSKVCKGMYPRISDKCSNDLAMVIGVLLRVDPNARPSCEQILKLNVVQKRIEYFKNFSGDDVSEDQALLKTINIPKNLLFLGDKLPQPNYEANNKNYNSFSHRNGKLLLEKEERMKKNNTVIEHNDSSVLPDIRIKLTEENKRENNKSIQVDDNSNRTLNKNKETISTNKEEEKSTERKLHSPPNKKKLFLPELQNKYHHDLPGINLNLLHNHPILSVNRNNSNGNKYKNNNNQQRMNNIYKLYAPIMNKNKYQKYNISLSNSGVYLKSIENRNSSNSRPRKLKKLNQLKGKLMKIY